MDRLDQRALQRLQGPSWDGLRSQFELIHDALVATSPNVQGTLTTIYIKYACSAAELPFAVLWVKNSKQLTLGLSIPDDYSDLAFVEPPAKHNYSGLNRFIVVNNEGLVPENIADIAAVAFRCRQGRQNEAV
jgi:hypothetical protein